MNAVSGGPRSLFRKFPGFHAGNRAHGGAWNFPDATRFHRQSIQRRKLHQSLMQPAEVSSLTLTSRTRASGTLKAWASLQHD